MTNQQEDLNLTDYNTEIQPDLCRIQHQQVFLTIKPHFLSFFFKVDAGKYNRGQSKEGLFILHVTL